MSKQTVFGHRAPAPRPTLLALALLALACALPVGIVLWIVEFFWL